VGISMVHIQKIGQILTKFERDSFQYYTT